MSAGKLMKNNLFNGWLLVLGLLIPMLSLAQQVKPGIEVLLEERLDLIMNKGVGLITNPTGVDSRLESTVNLLHRTPGVRLVALFGPEHGVRGDAYAGEKVETVYDKATGIPVFSLYGKTRQPTAEMLKNVDVLLYDIQDIGNRTYTYIYTMALAMTAAKEKGIPFIVLDRPNPLGGKLVEGPILDPQFSSFIGLYPIPYIYGLTTGELARYFNVELDIKCNLTVVPMKGWKRTMLYTETGLAWIPTSPHIPHAETPLYCAATGALGELNTINVGVGYTAPFEFVGEEWINADSLARELNQRKLPGVIFRPLHYRPYYGDRQKVALHGVQLHVTDPKKFQPVRTQIHILHALHKLYPERELFATPRTDMCDKAFGTDKIRQAIWDSKRPDDLIAAWYPELQNFITRSKQYYLYQ